MPEPTWNQPVVGCPHWDPDRLREMLVDRGLTFEEAAAECGVHPNTVKKWASRYGIVREAAAR